MTCNSASVKVIKCDRCLGKGTIPSVESLIKARKQAGISQQDVAKGMGISNQFLCDLEHGRRQWDRTRAESYLNVCKQQQPTES